MSVKLALVIAGKVGRFFLAQYAERRKAKAAARQAWREYQVERLNAELQERVSGKIPYDASIHEESMKHQTGRNPTTRISIKPNMKRE